MTWDACRSGGQRRRRGLAAGLVLCLAACGETLEEPADPPTPFPDPSPFTYPLDLWEAEIEGSTVLMIHVNERGAVDSVYVHETSRFAEFDSAAVRGAYQLRFSPARQGQRRIAMWTRLPVRFTRESSAIGLTAPADTGPR